VATDVATRTGPEAGPVVYDGFISYSHAADDLLAPRLQAGLQRFAKPWWKRRALRVFRDEASLSANPHLWSSITEAMDQSSWFVLLLSEDAARSVWVDREVAWWLEHKDPARIIPVVTDGQFGWTAGDISLESTAAPPSLRGAFTDEPRWVDLRFARSETQLDLRHTEFRGAVADIASAIRAVPKDELESEEVKLHRRTIRTAWTAGIALLVLGLAALVAAFIAVDQSNEVRTQRDEARARERAANSLLNLDVDPELSILLALGAVDAAGEVRSPVLSEPVTALHRALAASRVGLRLPSGWFVDYSPEGSVLATGLTNELGMEDAVISDAETGEQIRVLPSPEGRAAWKAAFSPDGDSLAVGYEERGANGTGGAGGPLVVLWDAITGEMVTTFDDSLLTDADTVAFSPDGALLAVAARSDMHSSVIVWEVDSGTEQYRIDSAQAPSFSPDGRVLAVAGSPTGVTLYDAATGREMAALGVPDDLGLEATAFDPTGQQLAAISALPAARLAIWDVAGGALELSLDLEGTPWGLEWSPSGRLVAVAGNEAPRLIDAATGDTVMILRGQKASVWDLAFHPTGDRLAAAGLFADTVIWDTAPAVRREVVSLATPYAGFGGMAYTADGTGIVVNAFHPEKGATVALIDPDIGAVQAELPYQQRGEFPVGPRLFPDAGLVASVNSDWSAALHDAQTFEKVGSLPDGFFALAVGRDGTRVLLNPIDNEGEAVVAVVGSWETLATLDPPGYAFFDPTGDRLMADGALIDVTTGSIVADVAALDVPDGTFFGRFSPNGNQVVFLTVTGGLLLLDVAALEAGLDMEQVLVWETTAHSSPTLWSYFSPDGTLIATMGSDGQLKVWDTATGALVADLGAFVWGHAFHPDGEHLIAGDTAGTIQVLTLNVDELIDIATSRITRSFTDDECATYRIDPCPTLEDLKSGSA
jgi:WD40 repeat protein